MRKTVVLSILSLLLLTHSRCGQPEKASALHANHCGSCHEAPAPAALPKSVWKETVLPEMAARLGIATFGYDPELILGPDEYALARAHGHYPATPALTHDDWHRLYDYIIDLAPDTLEAPPQIELQALTGFTPRTYNVDRQSGSLITYAGQTNDGSLITGDGYAKLTPLGPNAPRPIVTARAPIVHHQPHPAGDLLLEIGNIYPTEAHNGRLLRLGDGGRTEVIADSLHRPVYFLSTDLDDDGVDEIVICEYGNYTGALTLLTKEGDDYRRKRLSGMAGAIRVIAEDLDEDGRTDLLVLHAQGDEGIDALYQQADGSFRQESLLRFSPVWGTSWFELIDMDGDGDQDIVTVHGDNADYSNLRKPYHGLRIWTNDGNGHYNQAYFLPLPGATRVVTRDFDADGDIDLAVACNFADFTHQPEASFVYLEQQPGSDLTFTASTTPAALDGRWLIMEAFDADLDGDEDIVLGSFTLNPAPVPAEQSRRWAGDSIDVLVLTNDLLR